ncbi:MAG TPA: hypothetical protein PKD58_00625 [Candidatus Sumerlaeota bacterium]|nr:hypothetical protein [Candidatus Sumerlaeota bacterium]HMZ51714.1 hypothetical protein [Candidatus Sumerlaeota bacterium]HNM47447.1 hypothetical protein [Candidatus Sumerlaeota bacterium]
MMNKQDLAEKIIAMNGETVSRLERWFALFERRLAKAEEKGGDVDLKEIVNFTKALGEVIDLEMTIEKYLEEDGDDEQGTVDPEALRKLLSE